MLEPVNALREERGAKSSDLAKYIPFDFAIETGLIADENLVIWAHPFNPALFAMSAGDFDEAGLQKVVSRVHAIEGVNGAIRRKDRQLNRAPRQSKNWQAVRLAQHLELPIIYASDAHVGGRANAATQGQVKCSHFEKGDGRRVASSVKGGASWPEPPPAVKTTPCLK